MIIGALPERAAMEKAMLVIGTLLVVFVTYSSQRPTGAPSEACSNITPGHNGSSQPIPGGFYLYSDLIDAGGSYTVNTTYTITLEGSSNFRGFLIQARTAGTTTPIGSFSTPFGSKHLTCSGVSDASVTHTSNNFSSSLTFTWMSPSETGTVEFIYAVVVDYSTYYANINAAAHRPPSPTPSFSIPTSTPVFAPLASINIPSPSLFDDPPLSSSKVIISTSTPGFAPLASMNIPSPSPFDDPPLSSSEVIISSTPVFAPLASMNTPSPSPFNAPFLSSSKVIIPTSAPDVLMDTPSPSPFDAPPLSSEVIISTSIPIFAPFVSMDTPSPSPFDTPPLPSSEVIIPNSTPVLAPFVSMDTPSPSPLPFDTPPLFSSEVISTSGVSFGGYSTTESTTSSYAKYTSSVVSLTSSEGLLPTSLACPGHSSLVCKRHRVQTICKALTQQGKDPLPERCADAL